MATAAVTKPSAASPYAAAASSRASDPAISFPACGASIVNPSRVMSKQWRFLVLLGHIGGGLKIQDSKFCGALQVADGL